MATVRAYHRPATVDEALELLARPRAIPLGGGTKVNATPTAPVEVVDLQSLGLQGVERTEHGVAIGAMTRLQDVADSDLVPRAVRDAARRESPSTIRAAATLGGCVATADAASELLAALLVHDATVAIGRRDGRHTFALAAVLADIGLLRGAIITAVTVRAGGVSAWARTARTGADRAIVAAVARRADDGRVVVAVTGVAHSPILVPDVGLLDPPSDFRGSSEYRRRLAAVLVARAMEGIR